MTKEENEKRLERLKTIVARLPEKPGSYQYYDDQGTIIYVGKAKNLKSRVSSYFHTEVDRFKTKVLVSKIQDISYTVVNTEEDALLLENELIKKYNPRYNVLLKDGKTYPSICITNEYLPRIFKTRTINKKWGTYYGPYSHIGTMNAVLELINELYHPRTCRQPLAKEGIETGKYPVRVGGNFMFVIGLLAGITGLLFFFAGGNAAVGSDALPAGLPGCGDLLNSHGDPPFHILFLLYYVADRFF